MENKNMNKLADLIKNKFIKSNSDDSIVDGVITNRIKNKNGEEYFLVNAGLKSDCIIAVKDFDVNNVPKINDKMKFLIINHNQDGKIILSHSKLQKKELEKKIKSIYEKNEMIDVVVEIVLDNGYKVKIQDEVSGFLPMEDCVEDGKTESTVFKVGDVVKNVYISRFTKLNAKIQLSLRKTKNLFINDVVECIVKEKTDEILFVYIQNSNVKNAMIHMSDIDHSTMQLLNDTENLNTLTFKAKVIKIDDNGNTLLSVKKLVYEQWDKTNCTVGDEVECKVIQINDAGLTVVLNDGLEGFIHNFETSWNTNNININEQFKVDQMIKAKILILDKYKKQLKLSVKQLAENCANNPFNQFVKIHKVGDIIEKALVLNTNKSADNMFAFLFVQLIPGVDGRLTPKDMDWNEQRGRELFATLKPGTHVKVQITAIDESTQRVSVSVKSMIPDTFNDALKNMKIGQVYECEVTQSSYDGVRVIIMYDNEGKPMEKMEGCVFKNDLTKDPTKTTWKNFRKGDMIKAKFIKVDRSKTLILSIKAMENDIQKEEMDQYKKSTHKHDSNIGLSNWFNLSE